MAVMFNKNPRTLAIRAALYDILPRGPPDIIAEYSMLSDREKLKLVLESFSDPSGAWQIDRTIRRQTRAEIFARYIISWNATLGSNIVIYRLQHCSKGWVCSGCQYTVSFDRLFPTDDFWKPRKKIKERTPEDDIRDDYRAFMTDLLQKY